MGSAARGDGGFLPRAGLGLAARGAEHRRPAVEGASGQRSRNGQWVFDVIHLAIFSALGTEHGN